MHGFSFFSFKTKACGWNDAKYLCMCYFACQVQTIINFCSLYLISNSWRPRWRPCLVTSQTSSSATTRKIYLMLSRRSKAFHRRQNCFEILQHIKTLERGSINSPPPLPRTCTTVGVWLCVYFRGLIFLRLNIFSSSSVTTQKSKPLRGWFLYSSVRRDSNSYPDYYNATFAGFTHI